MRNVNDAKARRNIVFNAKYSLHKNADAVQQMFGIEVPNDILNMKNEIFYEFVMDTLYPKIIETLEVPADVLRSNDKFIKFYNETILPTKGSEIADVVSRVRACVRSYLQYYNVPSIDMTKIAESTKNMTNKFDTPEK